MCIAIFIPGCEVNDVSVLKEIGCDELFDRSATAMFADQFTGPGGQHGKLIYPSRELALASYQPDKQEWFDCGAYWIGYWKDRKPTPEMLARDPLIDGEPVLLCDDQTWVIPICEYFPMRLTFDRVNGGEKKVPSREHADYINWCNELFRWFITDEFQKKVEEEHVVQIENGLSFAAAAISKNYRVNADLVDVLGLVDELKAFNIARVATGLALIDIPEDQKKTLGIVGVGS